jgi:hypothetical protein
MIIAGVWYAAGYYFLTPLQADISKNENVRIENVTYCTLLCSKDPIPEKI